VFLNFGASLACEYVRVFSGSAGAIYVYDNFTQSSGTLTITNASTKGNGGVVDLGAPQRCLRMLHGLFCKVSRIMFEMDSQRLTLLHVEVGIQIPSLQWVRVSSRRLTSKLFYQRATILYTRTGFDHQGLVQPWALEAKCLPKSKGVFLNF